MSIRQLPERIGELLSTWNVILDDTLQTQTSFIGFGRRGRQAVVLKVLRQPGDEWRSGEVLAAFEGRGSVRVYEHVDGAMLLERLSPGSSLAAIALDGGDEEATGTLAEVIGAISPRESSSGFVTVQDWGEGFRRYRESGDRQIPLDLVEQARHLYLSLCSSQRQARLLHGDLQHYNVLFDSRRGWLAIDPKGVIGEIEYEIGAALRNPFQRTDLFASSHAVERRVRRYADILKLDADRILMWAFAQAILSAIWSVEDGFTVDEADASIVLANAIRPMIEI
jgi:streptomycin 6-kinase